MFDRDVVNSNIENSRPPVVFCQRQEESQKEIYPQLTSAIYIAKLFQNRLI